MGRRRGIGFPLFDGGSGVPLMSTSGVKLVGVFMEYDVGVKLFEK
jgi:hypothetical protein